MVISNNFALIDGYELFDVIGGADAGLIVSGVFAVLIGIAGCCAPGGQGVGICGIAAGITLIAAGISY
jgi:hypothetical protein